MDPVISKLIASREKSIAILVDEVAKFEKFAERSVDPKVQASFRSVAQVKRQRLVKLQEELAGFKAAASAQLEVPGTETAPPGRPARR